MNILIGCENSGIVREAFSSRGHNAVSVDLLPTEKPGKHVISDIFAFLGAYKGIFDIIIMHPTCTKLCVSGNHVYAKGKPKYKERLQAVKWTERLWKLSKRKAKAVCFENPVGVLHTLGSLPKPYYVQPYQFGHDASKKTGLYLWNLPPLKPTERITGRFVNGFERWSNQTDWGQNRLGPSDDRWKIRSKTYQGIADAMAEQWSDLIL